MSSFDGMVTVLDWTDWDAGNGYGENLKLCVLYFRAALWTWLVMD